MASSEHSGHFFRVPRSAYSVRIPRLLLVLIIGLGTWYRLDLIALSVFSFVLTLICSLRYPSHLTEYWRPELLLLWIATVAWLLFSVWAVWRALIPEPRVAKERRHLMPQFLLPRNIQWNRKMRIGVWVIGIYVLVGFICPLMAPVDPFAQGDLQTTRFRAPLTHGSVRSFTGFLPEKATSFGLEQSLLQVNRRLLTRDFEASPDFESPIGRPPDKGRVLFLMGTDGVGRDVFSRLLYGTRVSLSIGLSATFCGLLIGCLVGFCSGYFGGMIDRVLVWIVDVFLSIPSLFLVIVLIFVAGNSYFNLIVVLSLSGWMGIARLVRGEVLHLKDREFILAARLLGQSSAAIIRKHLLPNILPTILSTAVLLFSDTVLGEAGLSFLGLGIQPPMPSWGNMIGESLTYVDRAWWIAVFPGLTLSTLMVALHVVSEQIQEALKT